MPKAVAATVTLIAAAPLMVVVLFATSPASPAQAGYDAGLGGKPSALARQDIPPSYLAWYMSAAQTCPGLPWSVLAGIGKVESNHGRSRLPGVQSGSNSAGAEGPMQFLPPRSPGTRSTPTPAACSLHTTQPTRSTPLPGCCAPTEPAAAATLGSSRPSSPTTTPGGTSPTCWLGRPATPSPPASGAAAAAIAFAKAQLGKPYCWGGQGPNCFDCSGLVFAAYAAAGIHIARTTYQWQQDGPQVPLSQIQPGDLLFSAGSDGTPTNPGHVVMYLGDGQVIQAPQTGEDVQIDPIDLPTIVAATRPSGLGARP